MTIPFRAYHARQLMDDARKRTTEPTERELSNITEAVKTAARGAHREVIVTVPEARVVVFLAKLQELGFTVRQAGRDEWCEDGQTGLLVSWAPERDTRPNPEKPVGGTSFLDLGSTGFIDTDGA